VDQKRLAMLNALLIDDKPAAMDQLITVLSSVASEVKIVARIDSVDKTVDYLFQKPSIDIIFCGIQLPDGLAFEIFDQAYICAPVIFVADDEGFMPDAFEYNCLAYLSRPVEPGRLSRALAKYRMLNDHFHTNDISHNGNIIRPARHRMIVKKGKENILLPINDIALFHTGHRCVLVTDYLGKEYTAYKTLCDIEQELDKEQFFRVSRQYIVNINFIHGFKSYERVKLMIELTRPEIKHHVIVSQEMAPQFKEWMYNA
jgi:DNA-binding LytR/AlgR family response regulator